MDYEKAEAEVVTTENEDIISTSEITDACTRGNNGAMGNSGAHRNCNHKPSMPSF